MSSVDYCLPPSIKRAIAAWVVKFPKGRQSSAVIMALRLLQQEEGPLQDHHLDAVAAHLDMPMIQVESVFRFYSMFGSSRKNLICSTSNSGFTLIFTHFFNV